MSHRKFLGDHKQFAQPRLLEWFVERIQFSMQDPDSKQEEAKS